MAAGSLVQFYTPIIDTSQVAAIPLMGDRFTHAAVDPSRMRQLQSALERCYRRLAPTDGYTLIELIIVMALLLIVIGVLTDGFASATKAETDQTSRAIDQEAARQTLERITKDIHCASAATVSSTSGGYLLNLTETGGYCQGVTTGSSGVQWCTSSVGGSTTNYALYRTVSGTCDAANAIFQESHLTSGNVWSTPTCTSGQLPTVAVNMPVNRDPINRPGRAYTLSVAIALRNANACT